MKDFSTISPSAKALVMLKAYSSIPYADAVARLLFTDGKELPSYDSFDTLSKVRMMHFEKRYLAVSSLLKTTPFSNIIELASGYSMRFLEETKEREVYYVDTDLPEVIYTKKKLLENLNPDCRDFSGNYELKPLNCLDEEMFTDIAGNMPDGEIVIISEGLLMYLDICEKERLALIISKILKERGGAWITGDIYLKKNNKSGASDTWKNGSDFYEKHKIEENKFNDLDEAYSFFRRMGFFVENEASIDNGSLKSYKLFKNQISETTSARNNWKTDLHRCWKLGLR